MKFKKASQRYFSYGIGLLRHEASLKSAVNRMMREKTICTAWMI